MPDQPIILADLREIMESIPVGTDVEITIVQDGTAPINKKCYVWKDGMMIQCPCSGEHDGEIVYD